MTRGHESEKAVAGPVSASALVRIWRRIVDGVAGSWTSCLPVNSSL